MRPLVAIGRLVVNLSTAAEDGGGASLLVQEVALSLSIHVVVSEHLQKKRKFRKLKLATNISRECDCEWRL